MENKKLDTRTITDLKEEKNGSHYHLYCLSCGKEYPDTSFRLNCDNIHEPAFLRPLYSETRLKPDRTLPGIFQFSNWLPVGESLTGDGKSITYKSEKLASMLGLENLFISFNGYWPERDAFMNTCTFKELEAFPVISRLLKSHKSNLVVASAGNTARAFANVCSQNSIPLYLVVPEFGIDELWLTTEPNEHVKLIVVKGDYTDAIMLADRLASESGFTAEGGAKNVARRDGMGTTVLDAALFMGEVPDHYFQAIGSGTGAIAAWESNLKLVQNGQFGDENKRMKLHLAQNIPFTPISQIWRSRSKNFPSLNDKVARQQIEKIYAKVLSNRKPPYSVKGGLYDSLTDTNGLMYEVSNAEALEAEAIFEKLEGIDIVPAASVAVAALIQAVEQNRLDCSDTILLNVTGGGEKRLKKDVSLRYLQPSIVIDNPDIDLDFVIGVLGV